MKIALFGASGNIGRRIVGEALERGHVVTGLERNPKRVTLRHERLAVATADVTRAEEVARAASGHDAIVSAVGPSGRADAAMLIDAAHALVAGARRAKVPRIVVIGGAGSLEVKSGQKLLATRDFPSAWKPAALAHRDALTFFRSVSDLDWTYVSPAAFVVPGRTTRRFRIGGDQLLVDEQGKCHISTEDLSVAILDELERPAHVRERITVAY